MPLYNEPGQLYTEPGVYYTAAPIIVPPFTPPGWTVDTTHGELLTQPVIYLVVELATGTIVDEVPLTQHRFTRGVSTPGGWSGSIPFDHPKATYQNLEPNRMAAYVVIDDTLQFGGIIRQPSVDLNEDGGQLLQVGGDGIFGYFRGDGSETGRFLTTNESYIAPAIDIVETLVNLAQGIAGGDIGLEIVKHGEGPDIGLTLRGYEYNNIGATVERICEENDIEWDVDYRWDRTVSPSRPVAILTLDQGGRGVRKELDLVLGKNIKMLSYTPDGFRQANRILGVGAGDGKNMVRVTASDPSLISPTGSYPLLERVVTDKTITTKVRMAQRANAKLRRSRQPARTAIVQLLTEGIASEEVPFGSFTTGDEVRLFANTGYIAETGDWWRILGYDVEHDDQGARSVKLDLASSDEFEG